MRLPERYRPPFVTEVDEPVHDDCVVATTFMQVAAATLGEVTDRPSGETMTKLALKRFREGMRDTLSPESQTGGLRVADAQRMVARTWPHLPHLPSFTYTFDEMWTLLENGDCVGLWGNPAEVRKPASDLRRWTFDDSFGHDLFVLRAKDDRAWVMDPLGYGAYRGEWVPRAHLRQYAYLDDGYVRSATIAPIGGWTTAALAARRAAAVERDLREDKRDLAARILELEANPPDCANPVAAARERALVQARDAIDLLRTTP